MNPIDIVLFACGAALLAAAALVQFGNIPIIGTGADEQDARRWLAAGWAVGGAALLIAAAGIAAGM